jgi:hypothetical protein
MLDLKFSSGLGLGRAGLGLGLGLVVCGLDYNTGDYAWCDGSYWFSPSWISVRYMLCAQGSVVQKPVRSILG